jgi:cytochrome c-type biogenesis protein CcmH/NrfG
MKRLASPAGIAAILLMMVTAATAYFTAIRFAAEMISQDARYHFERWDAGRATPQAGEVSVAVASLRAALDYEPRNPNLHWYLGRIDYWRVRSGSLTDAESRAVRQVALESFRQAALLRPTSGHSWVNLALTRYVLGQVDAEFVLALEQTLRWAPWQPQIQLIGIQLGVATWQLMPLSTQMLLIEAIRRQAEWKMADQKPALIRLLRGYGRNELGCPWAGKALACPGT